MGRVKFKNLAVPLASRLQLWLNYAFENSLLTISSFLIIQLCDFFLRPRKDLWFSLLEYGAWFGYMIYIKFLVTTRDVYLILVVCCSYVSFGFTKQSKSALNRSLHSWHREKTRTLMRIPISANPLQPRGVTRILMSPSNPMRQPLWQLAVSMHPSLDQSSGKYLRGMCALIRNWAQATLDKSWRVIWKRNEAYKL